MIVLGRGASSPMASISSIDMAGLCCAAYSLEYIRSADKPFQRIGLND